MKLSPVTIWKGGRVASTDPELQSVDVRVEDGRITAAGPDLPAGDGEEVIDAAGCILLPGLFDLRTHLREPGREDQESLRSGTEAAIRGGFTGVVAMPNTTPPIDTAAMARFIASSAREVARIPVYPAGCLSKQREGVELAEVGDMQRQGAVMITDDDRPVEDPNLLRRAFEYSRALGLPVGIHGDVAALSGDGVVNDGPVSYRLGMAGRPACAEEIGIERDLRLAQYTGGRVHVHHLSTAEGLAIVRRFREAGLKVTCEVTPHHLLFCEDDMVDYNTHLKMNPPLRMPADRDALVAGVRDGHIDVIATDHAPHTIFEKNLDFQHAPFGVTGLETALCALYAGLVAPGELGWNDVVRALSVQPRALIGLEPAVIAEGHTAEFVVFAPDGETTFTRDSMASKSGNTPYLNKTLPGAIRQVVLGDRNILAGKEKSS